MRYIKLTSILLSFGIIEFCSAAISTYDGKPGCKTLGEIGNLYRHFWDPIRYFRCIALNVEPLQETCPDGSGFQQSLSTCVMWRVWKWEIPTYPPSCPDGVMCLSTEKRLPILVSPAEPYASVPGMPPSSETFVPSSPFLQPSALINSRFGYRPAWQVAERPLVQSSRIPGASLLQLSSTQPWASAQPLVSVQPFASAQPLASIQPLTSLQPLPSAQPLTSTQPLYFPPTNTPQISYDPHILTPIQPLSVNGGII
ncbi:uncharacterized protein LOC105665107 [Ceratitis capitata]|uniref:uncharacterized protein LOC105665107 n=1 Tax=Ceratitis capitata TaxID=7213 RepID=UPI0006189202|nr:uncharacterized protein LOC105665107 [Ceratitis capitata]